MEFIPDPISQYSESYTEPESKLLHSIDRETHLNELYPRMLSGHLQGRFLSMLSLLTRPKYILEIGTYTGYSAICLAEGLQPGGLLVTIDYNQELEEKVNGYFQQSGHSNHIEMMIGHAHEIIPKLSYTWDMVFIDADKERYSLYFDMVIEQVRPGGLIVADNVLWSGKVLETEDKDKATLGVKAFNQKVHEDPRVQNVLLPVRDGLMLMRKK